MPWPAEPWGTQRTGSSVRPLHGRPVPRSRRHLRAVVDCEAVRSALPLVVDGSLRPTPAVAEHLSRCLSCQAEQASYQRLLRALRSLHDEGTQTLPTSLSRALHELHALPDGYGVPSRRSPVRVIAAVVAGAAVVGAGVAVAWGARRPAALPWSN
jgi:predicted anti-sigma-YlaC factor YlaD